MKQNKYQEAFTEIHHILEQSHLHGMGTIEQKHFDDIKALVEKEIPMKPIGDVEYSTCSVCNHMVCDKKRNILLTRCGNSECGRVVDWSVEE